MSTTPSGSDSYILTPSTTGASTATPSYSATTPSPPHSPSPSHLSYSSHSHSHSDLDSLPSSSSSSSASDLSEESDDEEETDAEREWKESLQQLELFLTMVIVPYLGKYFGRKCAYWGWARFMEWKYPVEVVITSKRSMRVAGAVEAAATL
ncbi:MAG: hypothetical protein MMC33_007760 [Icmadophila ericetorum]|nr:hypothetical protein [Icmadophila ericetorum]